MNEPKDFYEDEDYEFTQEGQRVWNKMVRLMQLGLVILVLNLVVYGIVTTWK